MDDGSQHAPRSNPQLNAQEQAGQDVMEACKYVEEMAGNPELEEARQPFERHHSLFDPKLTAEQKSSSSSIGGSMCAQASDGSSGEPRK